MGVEGVEQQAEAFEEALVNDIGKKFVQKVKKTNYFTEAARRRRLRRCAKLYKNGSQCSTFFTVDAKNHLACPLHRASFKKQLEQAELEKLRTEKIVREEQLRQIREKTNRRESRPLPTFSQAPFRPSPSPSPIRTRNVSPVDPVVTTTTNTTTTTVTTNIIPSTNPPINASQRGPRDVGAVPVILATIPPPLTMPPPSTPRRLESQELAANMGNRNLEREDMTTDSDLAPLTALATQFQQQVQWDPSLLDEDNDVEMGDTDAYGDYAENQYQEPQQKSLADELLESDFQQSGEEDSLSDLIIDDEATPDLPPPSPLGKKKQPKKKENNANI